MSEMLSSKWVKTRKPHKCFGCLRDFDKGTRLLRESWTDCGSAYTSYLCSDCNDYATSGTYPFCEFSYGGLRDTILEIVGER